ncbi:divalent cation tolerance protein CutA [Streptomyces celluloflavus]
MADPTTQNDPSDPSDPSVTSVFRREHDVEAIREWRQVPCTAAAAPYAALEAYLPAAHDDGTREIAATPITRDGAGHLSWIAEGMG